VLTGQYPILEGFTPVAPLLAGGKKVLVLMTDGVPYPDPDNTAKDKCVQAVTGEYAKAAPAGPVLTFAVGIGYTFPYDPNTYDPLFMAKIAVAGGTAAPGCVPYETKYAEQMCHFQITPVAGQNAVSLEQNLLIAFDKIRASVTSCELALDRTGLVDPTLVNVVFTDAHNLEVIVPADATDGWTYDDPKNSPTRTISRSSSPPTRRTGGPTTIPRTLPRSCSTDSRAPT
jgi:hypothetical protein